MTEEPEMNETGPARARQVEAYHDASTYLESEAAALRRRVDDLLNYAYGVVYDGEQLDRDELDGFVRSLVGSLDELTGSAYAVADAADPEQKELREWLHEANERAWASDRGQYEVTLPLAQGRRVVVYAVNPDQWTVERQRALGNDKWEREHLSVPVQSPILREALAQLYSFAKSRDWALTSEREAFGRLATLRAQAAD